MWRRHVLLATSTESDHSDVESEVNAEKPDPKPAPKSLTTREVCDMVTQMRGWAAEKGHSKILAKLMDVSDDVNDLVIKGTHMKQTTMADFFNWCAVVIDMYAY